MITKPIKLVLLLMPLFLVFSSCVSNKKMIYFQDAENTANLGVNPSEIIINIDDELFILVSGMEPESVAPFNLTVGNTNQSQQNAITYLVDANGNITFPVLGEIYVVGKTTLELKELLTEKLSQYVKKPIVNIRLRNFRFSVLGEVKSPGNFTVANERVSVLEALAMAGDLTIQGKRKNIKLFRNETDGVKTYTIDLTDANLFTSSQFYLSQNDVLYVEPNKVKVNSSAIGTTSSIISIATAVLSLVLIFTR